MRPFIQTLEFRRLFAAGDLDSSFGGGDGILDLPIDPAETELSTVVLPDNRILVLGASFGDHAVSVTRFNANGTLDTTFGDGGHAGFDINPNPFGQAGQAIYPQANGKILVRVDAAIDQLDFERYFVRLNANGSLDATFGTGGFLRREHPDLDELNVAVQPDGRILIASTRELYRLAIDGSPDMTFGTAGVAAYGGMGGLLFSPESHIPLALASGKIVVVGRLVNSANPNSGTPAIVRLNGDGTADATFGADGFREIPQPFGNLTLPLQVVEVAGGKLIILMAERDGARRMVVGRVNTDGTLDTTFDGDGLVAYGNHAILRAQRMGVDGAGRIVIGGRTPFGSVDGFAVFRLLGDGSLDDSFGRVVGGSLDVGYRSSTIGLQSDGGVIMQVSATAPASLLGPEDTRLLKLAAGGTSPSPISLNGGTLAVTGTEDTEGIRVDLGSPEPSAPAWLAATRNGIGRAFDPGTVSRLLLDARGGDDVVALADGITIPAQIAGGTGNDRLVGGDGDDSIQGNAGHDRIDGGAGDDRLDGHAGRDRIRGEAGNDRLFGGDNNDRLAGGDGADLLFGHLGSDHLNGNAGRDRLMGSDGDDVFASNDGELDDLYGGGGSDLLLASDDVDLITDIETT